MSKPRDISKIEAADFVTIGELAVLAKVRYSTLKYYSEIGLLPYIQPEERRNRKYHKETCFQILAEIQKLKNEQRFTIDEIIEYFQTKNNTQAQNP